MRETRKHVVTFRLTENEYELLKSACGADQTSISAAARYAILQWAKTRPAMDERLGEISERLDWLVGMLDKGAKGKK